MLGARALNILWVENPQIRRGRIETRLLSGNTTYGAYFVYTIVCHAFDLHYQVKMSVSSENEMEDDASLVICCHKVGT